MSGWGYCCPDCPALDEATMPPDWKPREACCWLTDMFEADEDAEARGEPSTQAAGR